MRSKLPAVFRRSERGISVAVTSLMMVFVIPMIGLSIDATMLYVVKTKLQGAVDGAALAAAKALSRGADDTTHKNAATTAAKTYVKLNYPSTFFFSQDVQIDPTSGVSIDLSVANQRTVTVTATVAEPTLFMRWLNFTSTTVAATATTVRKDVNIVLVLDRSGSMSVSNSCTPMIAAATNFINRFTPGRDNMAIISFATTTQLQVPITTNWIHNSTETGGGKNLSAALAGINCQGSTSSAEALWYAYNELVGLNQPAALNFIVFFTDGQPTGIDVNMPVSTTNCNSGSLQTATSTTPGMVGTGYAGKYIPNSLLAVYTDGSAWIGLATPVVSPNADMTPNIINADQGNSAVAASNGCKFAASWYSNWTQTVDYQGIPRADIYGNSTIDTSYNAVSMSGNWVAIDAVANGLYVAANAANSAAKNIRHGNNMTILSNAGKSLSGVIIHSIGLGNASVPLTADDSFLARVSNTKVLADGTTANPGYESAYGSGTYKYAANTGDLGTAFDDIASEIIRLAK
jgi:Mg-chelatase subunit ChlD